MECYQMNLIRFAAFFILVTIPPGPAPLVVAQGGGWPSWPSSSGSGSGSTSSSDNHYLTQSSQCCENVFSGPGKRCFDLKQCNNGGGDGGGNLFGWTFAPQQQSFGFPIDIELQNMCTCMATAMTFSGRKVGKLCCSEPVRNKPQGFEEQQQQEHHHHHEDQQQQQQEEVTKPPPSINFEPKPEPVPTPAPAPATADSSKDDGTIHALGWTPAVKSAVLSHRNLNLLPSLDICGVNKAKSGVAPYIIGGIKAKLGEHPWMALLGIQSPDPSEGLVYACGGTLLNSRYVLTAAHCVAVPPLPPGYKVTTIRLGEFDQTKGSDPDCDATQCAPNVQNIDVEQIISHKEYSLKTHEHDIALIRLAKPVELGPYVTPICMPSYDFVRTGREPERLTVAGWGRTRFDVEDGSDILQEVKVPIATKGKCESYFKDLFGAIKEGRFCSGGESSKDSCRGDSGGPIMGPIAIRPAGAQAGGAVGGTPTRMVQLGIVSVGREDAQCSMAGEGHLTLYTKVAQYLPWILDHIRP